jgi:hypothetical protein
MQNATYTHIKGIEDPIQRDGAFGANAGDVMLCE